MYASNYFPKDKPLILHNSSDSNLLSNIADSNQADCEQNSDAFPIYDSHKSICVTNNHLGEEKWDNQIEAENFLNSLTEYLQTNEDTPENDISNWLLDIMQLVRNFDDEEMDPSILVSSTSIIIKKGKEDTLDLYAKERTFVIEDTKEEENKEIDINDEIPYDSIQESPIIKILEKELSKW